MEFSKIVSVQGQPGLFETLNVRGDGLIVRPLDGGKANFVSARNAGFSLLENISIYTQTDAEPLKEVLKIIAEKKIKLPDPKKSSNDDLKKFFKEVLPEYDEDQVYISDIKKVIKWYKILEEKKIIEEILKTKSEDTEEPKDKAEKKVKKKAEKKDTAESKKKSEPKPKAKAKAKEPAKKKATAAKKTSTKKKAAPKKK